MKVLIIKHGPFPGFHSPDAKEYAKHLMANGVDVRVLAIAAAGQEVAGNFVCPVEKISTRYGMLHWREIQKHINGADVIHYMPGKGLEFLRLLTDSAKIIFDFRSVSVRGNRVTDFLIDQLKRLQGSCADRLITINRNVARQLRPFRRIPISEMPAGYPRDLFFPCARRANGGRRILFYSGIIARSRRLEKLIEMIARLPRAYVLHLVGPTSRIDSDYPDWLRGYARELGCLDRVLFIGGVPQAELRGMIAEAYLCLCCIPVNDCYNHQFPYKLLDYLACNRPVLATRTVAIAAFAGQNTAESLLFTDDSSESFADCVMASEDYIERFYSAANLAKIDAELWPHSWESLIKTRLIGIYEATLAGKATAFDIDYC